MVNYPAKIDTTTSLPTVVDNFTSLRGITINRLRDAILAIESELGVKPSGISGTVSARLTSIENAITSGSNTIFGNDLSGTATSQTVIGIQNKPISNITPADGYALIWNGLTNEWTPREIITGSTIGDGGFVNLNMTGTDFGSETTYGVESTITDGNTSDATPTILLSELGVSNQATKWTVSVLGVDQNTGDTYTADLYATFNKFGVGIVTSIGSGGTPQNIQSSGAASAWSCSLSTDGTSIIITVIGAAATTIKWKLSTEKDKRGY